MKTIYDEHWEGQRILSNFKERIKGCETHLSSNDLYTYIERNIYTTKRFEGSFSSMISGKKRVFRTKHVHTNGRTDGRTNEQHKVSKLKLIKRKRKRKETAKSNKSEETDHSVWTAGWKGKSTIRNVKEHWPGIEFTTCKIISKKKSG